MGLVTVAVRVSSRYDRGAVRFIGLGPWSSRDAVREDRVRARVTSSLRTWADFVCPR